MTSVLEIGQLAGPAWCGASVRLELLDPVASDDLWTTARRELLFVRRAHRPYQSSEHIRLRQKRQILTTIVQRSANSYLSC